MIRNLFFLTCLLISVQVFAQTGIGTPNPDPSAKLHVNATDKGFLPPRVALTSTNSANPIVSPANGLMVFNTASAGASPFNVVPGYYYWDGTGQQWVSLSTTVGNVQNQAVFRSTSNTNADQAITSWNARFNNIASGDLTVTSLTTFTLSNGIYKIEWALPYQSTNTYNTMQLQEFLSGSWSVFRGDGGYANLSNGGNTDWGGGTFAADILDCSSTSKTIRIINNDGASRTLFYGVSLIITKLNPSITTSTTADNLGNHIASSNIQLNNNFLSNDGGNEGIRVDNSGNVGIGANSPTEKLEVNGNVKANNFIGTASSSKLFFLEANASVTYTLPGSYTVDPCRYSIVNTVINVPISWFNTTNYRFTPQKAGYWEIIASYDVFRGSEGSLIIQKNGSAIAYAGSIESVIQQIRKIIYLNGSTDYITIANTGFSSNSRSQDANKSWFQARWVGE